jgi:protein-tyrosine-phosphatase
MANVCRSPLMAASFAEHLRASGSEASWSVMSGGTDVSRELGMCDVAASLASPAPASREFCAAHRSRPVRAESLAGVQLVIAASREERGLLARLDHGQRSRTFTLQEAVLLGSQSLGAIEEEHALATVGASEPLRAYAYALNLRRSRAQLLGPPSRFPAISEFAQRITGRTSSHPLDVPDAHHLSDRQHRRALHEVKDTVRTLHDQISCFLSTAA